ncbi:MAG: Unknown protein [uncultured Sulfurovum sp.]|uniref:DUF6471 domain-containing protein n=1 Tax=uncultured Sulfurovum sp. TaxID=269237 RepID=A0A6S6UHF3_9BACT|nr:MAG: Unknown protein [uncultured Sulfurovum sp.]
MKLKGIKSKELAELLKEYDENLTELSLNNKFSRGSFSATFFFKCMRALDIEVLREEEWR